MNECSVKAGYVTVTELPNGKASKEQISRLRQRYHFALGFCRNKRVLEVACGSGMGLGYLAQSAAQVVGCDVDEDVLAFATDTYGGRENIEIVTADAHHLPFADHTFDVVLLYEALYYLAEPDRFVAEARRVLGTDGALIIATANKDWAGFNPSPYSVRYFSAPELYSCLRRRFPSVAIYGACPAVDPTLRGKLVSLIKRVAVALHLIPKTMKGKEFLKRLFFGKLAPLPREIRDAPKDYEAPVPIPPNEGNSSYKVLYAVASTGNLKE